MDQRIASEIASNYLNEHFNNIWTVEKNKQITPSPPGPLLYPSTLLVIESKDHFIIELLGHQASFDSSLAICKRRIKNTVDHFDQFGDGSSDPAADINIGNVTFKDLVFCRTDENDELIKRFPILKGYGSRAHSKKPNGLGSLIRFRSDMVSCTLKNCAFINANSGFYRLKFVHYGLIITKATKRKYFNKVLKRDFPPNTIVGVSSPRNKEAEAMLLTSQLQSLYLSRTIHETTIGSFLSSHPSILTAALDAKKHIYEPFFEWLDRPEGIDVNPINPDMMICRSDNYWDIVDFKTAALNKKKLTKGRLGRVRFIDYIYEGISQLVHYAKYFQYEKNRQYAENKYGIKVKNLNLYLIAGSMENYDKDMIQEALRAHHPISLVDYDTIVEAYLEAARI